MLTIQKNRIKTEANIHILRLILAWATFTLLMLTFTAGQALAKPFDITPYNIPSGEQEAFYIATSDDGDIWFVERQYNNLSKIDAITGEISEYSIPDIGADCGGLANGPDNNIWFIKGTTGKISRWNITNNTETEFNLPPLGGGCLSGLISGPDNNLWFTHESGKIGKMTLSGTVTTYDIPGGGVGMQMSVGPDGNIWFSNIISNTLVKITTDGNITSFSMPVGVSGGYGITTGADNHIWVSSMNNKIAKFNIGSEEFNVYDAPADSYPMLLSLGGDGNVWFGSAGGLGIGRIDQSGVATMFDLPDTEAPIPIFSIATGSYGNIFGITYGKGVGDVSKVYKLELPESQMSTIGNTDDCTQIQLISGTASTGVMELTKLSKNSLPPDGDISYITDLADYRLTVPIGSTQRVQLLFQTCAQPNQVLARKYSAQTRQYATLKNAQITPAKLNGNPALLLAYDITDGGLFDDDGLANGVIVDPVGLAIGSEQIEAQNQPVNKLLSDTGENSLSIVPTGILIVFGSIITSVLVRSNSKKT